MNDDENIVGEGFGEWHEVRAFMRLLTNGVKQLKRIADAAEGKVNNETMAALKRLEAVLDVGKENTMSANSDAVSAEIDAIIVKVQALQASQGQMNAAEKAQIDAKLAILSQFADPAVPNPMPVGP